MAHERIMIETDDGPLDIPQEHILGLEIELDTELASLFRLRLALVPQSDGSWTYLDEERLQIWKPLSIKAGFEGDLEDLMSGYITHTRPAFEADRAACTLEIWGMDGSVLMDREEKLKDWPSETDSSIAEQIFDLYGFAADVEGTGVVHDEAISTIIQRETDMQFLKRLARRNGFECYVDGEKGFFRKPRLGATPQPLLAVHFGDETNVTQLSLEVNALTPANVSVFQVDLASKEVLEAAATSSQQPALGATANLLPSGIPQGQAYIGMHTATGLPEMTALAQGMFHEAEWFVTVEGEIAGNQYGHVLKPRGTVTLKGVGETYSGIYYVTHVTHSFSRNGYTQLFRAKRNALMPTGAEDFTGPSQGLGGFL